MRRADPAHGMSMIELIMVIVILGIAAVAIGSAFMHSSRSLRLNEDMQRAWQIAQECADHVLGTARKPGAFTAVSLAAPSSICSSLPADAGFTRVVNVTAAATGSTTIALCNSTAWACRRVDIQVSRGAATIAALNFMLIQY
jgi:prepilin-type N-terminal cleavage/methylation domain-containing protein